MRDTSTLSRESNRFTIAEGIAYGTTLGALLLTFLLAAYTTEANPVAASLFEALGYAKTAAVAFAVVALAYGLVRRLAREYPVVAEGGAWSIATIGLLDLAINVRGLLVVGPPETIWFARTGEILGAAAIGAGVVLVTRQWGDVVLARARGTVELVGSYGSRVSSLLTPSSKAVRSSLSIALSLLVVVSTMSGLVLIGTSPIGVASASTTVIDDMEGGSSTVSTSPSGSVVTNQSAAYQKDESFRVDSSLAASSKNEFTFSAPDDAFSFWFKTNNFGNDQYDNRYIQIVDSGGTRISELTFTSSGFVEAVSGVNFGGLDPHKFYRIRWSGLSGGSSYYIEISDANGNVIHNKSIGVSPALPTKLVIRDADGVSHKGWYDYFVADSSPTKKKVSGYVKDESGNIIENATISTNTSVSTTSDSSGKWSTKLSNGTYEITAKKSGWIKKTKTVTVSGTTTGVNFTLSKNAVTGTVVSQTGDPVSGVTVQAYGINYSHPDIEGSSDPTQKARDILDSYAEAIPSSWDKSIDVASRFKGSDSTYVAVTSKGIDGDPWLADNDIGQPKVRIPADQKVVFSVWDATKTGTYYQNEYDDELPGSVIEGTGVVVEQISAKGDTLSKVTLKTNETVSAGGLNVLDPGKFNYAEASLSPGFYRVYPKGNPNAGYVIQVGSAREAGKASTPKLIAPNIENQNGSLADSAKPESDALANNKMVFRTTTTGPNGKFTIQLPGNVETVSLQVVSGRAGSGASINFSDVNQVNKLTELSGKNLTQSSFVFSTAPKISEVPNSGVKVRVFEFSTPPFENLGDQLNLSQLRENLLENLSMADLPKAVQNNLSKVNKKKIEELYNQLSNLSKKNQRLEDRVKQLLKKRNGDSGTNETINLYVDPSNATRTELLRRVASINDALNQLRSTIESGQGETSTTSETVSWTKPFEADLNPEAVAVRVHYTNGTTRVLSTESQYVRVADEVGDDKVVISQLPLGKAAGAGIEISVATSEGTGEASRQFKNPAYSGDMPSIKALSLSTLNPGPSEQVTATIKPTATAPYSQLEAVTVRAPNGSELAGATIVDADTLRFETNGSGIYSIRATFSTANGRNHTLVHRISASNESVDMPASVRVKSGPFGTYAVVGDGFSGGDVELAEDGSTVSVVATVKSGTEAPDEVAVYASGVSLPAESTVRVRVAKGPHEKTVGKHVKTTVHLGALPSGALLYRNGEPLPKESKYGTVSYRVDQTRIQTVTDDQGTLRIKTDAKPSLWERLSWNYENLDLNLPLSTGLPVGFGVGLLPLAGLVLGTRRWSA